MIPSNQTGYLWVPGTLLGTISNVNVFINCAAKYLQFHKDCLYNILYYITLLLQILKTSNYLLQSEACA